MSLSDNKGTVREKAHSIRLCANMIEANVSALKPDEANAPLYEVWEQTMLACSQQFNNVINLLGMLK